MGNYRSRIIAVLIAVSLFAAGCGSNGAVKEADNRDTPEQETAEADTGEEGNDADDEGMNENEGDDDDGGDDGRDLIRVGFAQVGHESDWRTASTASAQDVFSEAGGYELLFVDSDNNAPEQVSAVSDFIKQKVDYIVIDPILPTGWDDVLAEAKNEGIPVFIIDRTIDCDDDMYVAWYGSDFAAEGQAAAKWLKKYLKSQGRDKDSIRIVTITGNKGSSAQKGRSKGFAKVAEKQPEWDMLGEKDGEFTEEGGRSAMLSFIKSYEGIDVVVCQNDNEAWGAMAALDSENISYGVNGDVIIISFDAVRDGLKKVMEGKINADFECNPLAAPYVAEAIQTVEAGGTIANKINYIDEACFQAKDYVESVKVNGRVIPVVTVDEEVLAGRAY